VKSRLKVAMIGTGYFSQFHTNAWSRCSEVDVVGVADLDLDRASKVANELNGRAYDDVAVMLQAEQPDIVDIITPPATHLPIIRMAAERGIDVICQKPFCGNLTMAKEAVSVVQTAGIELTVHENFRFQPWYHAMKGQVQANRLGSIYRVTFKLRPGDGQGPQAYLHRQPYFQKMERFLIHETAIHFIDVFRYLLGDVNSVWADLAKFNPVISGEDNCVVVMTFDGNVRGVLDGNRLSDHAAENPRRTMGEMSIEGELGELRLDGNGNVRFRSHGSADWQIVPFEWDDIGFGGDCVYRFTRHVVDHYVSDTPLQNSAQDYLANLKIEEAIYASAQHGRVEKL